VLGLLYYARISSYYLPVVFEVDIRVFFHLLHQELRLSVRVEVGRHGESDVHVRVGREKFAFSHGIALQPGVEFLENIRQRQVVPPRSFAACGLGIIIQYTQTQLVGKCYTRIYRYYYHRRPIEVYIRIKYKLNRDKYVIINYHKDISKWKIRILHGSNHFKLYNNIYSYIIFTLTANNAIYLFIIQDVGY